MIHLLREKATPDKIQAMLEEYDILIKIVVDNRRGFLAGGGEMHAHCEQFLLDDGSEQDDLWGANWDPEDQRMRFDAQINIRPRLDNRSTLIQSEEIRRQVEAVSRQLLGDVL